MFNSLSKLFQPLSNFLLNLLSRMKVFYQILIIIIIMAAFLVLEGYFGYNIITQMQDVSIKIFRDSVHNTRTVQDVANEIIKIRTDYMSTLIEERNLSIDMNSLDSLINNLDRMDPSIASMLKPQIKDLRKILGRPINKENCKEFISKIGRSFTSSIISATGLPKKLWIH